MTADNISTSIKTGNLQLTNRDKLAHYGIVGFLLFIFFMLVLFYVRNLFTDTRYTPETSKVLAIGAIIPGLLGILFYIIQRKRLKLKVTETSLPRATLDKIVAEVAEKLNWKFYIMEEKVIVAKTSPSFFSGSWGEQITILFEKDKVYVNSICDPNKQSSVVSLGRNKKNVNTLLQAITAAENKQFEIKP